MILVLLCSPHRNGVTDKIGSLFTAGAISVGAEVETVALRELKIAPCCGCGICDRPPHNCILAKDDDAEMVFARFMAADAAVIISPIYFYALPAQFKALVDRGQRFWAASKEQVQAGKPVLTILNASRKRGEKLFSGAMLTLDWFLKFLNARIVDSHNLRGLEKPEDMPRDEENIIYRLGCNWGKIYCDTKRSETAISARNGDIE